MSENTSIGGDTAFYVTGGTLRHDAPSYVERAADRQLLTGLQRGDFCYVLTARQMGKSSLMVRTANELSSLGLSPVVIDLTAIGPNITPEQWYDGLILRVGRRLRLENEIEDYWTAKARLSPVQRFFSALREVVLPRSPGQVILFVDEIDVVRSLPFSTGEFFGAIRECYNRRVEDQELKRLTFCLLGAAAPADLIRDAHTTPFNIGSRIELTDFTDSEASPLAAGLQSTGSGFEVSSSKPSGSSAGVQTLETTNSKLILGRIIHWTNGHPYLTQRLCRAVVEKLWGDDDPFNSKGSPRSSTPTELVDELCEELFLSSRAREQDDNLLYVRERLLRAEVDLAGLLGLYEQVYTGQPVRDDESNLLIENLRLSGIVRIRGDCLESRNRIYQRVFDAEWIRTNMPEAVLSRTNGDRFSIKGTASIGRGPSNSVVLSDDKVSRRHALVQAQGQHEFWLVDLGSSNGTFLNGRRVSQPILLHDKDRIDIGPFRLVFSQSHGRGSSAPVATREDKTIHDVRSANCWLLVAVVGATTQIVRPAPGKDYPMITGAWIAECKKIVEEYGGTIRKFLDDGFYASWINRDKAAVARALESLRQLQEQAMPSFTMTLHHGMIFSSGGRPANEECLEGKIVDFVFRMENVAAFLGESRLMSEAANDEIKGELSTDDAGRHEMRDFEGTYQFFRF